eukprot:TRINITY_DN6081_c0_g2_i1.p1 TRINITY_DN6081_c0_g2~~TRINITY_DN6081_c0_g2_i1.p1  ORF type:complete len:105 (-),score=29.37 TRINITY_DN6081_c0_g2_i1:178-492(-)
MANYNKKISLNITGWPQQIWTHRNKYVDEHYFLRNSTVYNFKPRAMSAFLTFMVLAGLPYLAVKAATKTENNELVSINKYKRIEAPTQKFYNTQGAATNKYANL